MKNILTALIAISCLLISAGHGMCQSELFRDKESMDFIEKSLDLLYNFEFDEGEKKMLEIKEKYPDHPAYYFYMAMSLYNQNFPINSKSPKYSLYKSYLNKTLEKSAKMTDRDAQDFEGIFFALSAQGYLALLYSEDNDYMKAGNIATKAYGNMKKAFELKEKFPEFWFFSGLYNYYIVNYPEQHPVTKPVFIFFKNGNKATGFKEMKIACQKAFFTKVEAHYFLATMYSKYESRFDSAFKYVQIIVDKYPENLNFISKLTECLVMTGQYSAAKPYFVKLKNAGGLYAANSYCFYAMMIEKANNNFAHAETHYRRALELCANARQSTANLESICYAGLARCMRHRGNKEEARSYYKKVLNLTEYKHLTKEAKDYLDQ